VTDLGFAVFLPQQCVRGVDSHIHLFPTESYSLTRLVNTCGAASRQSLFCSSFQDYRAIGLREKSSESFKHNIRCNSSLGVCDRKCVCQLRHSLEEFLDFSKLLRIQIFKEI